MAKLTAAKVKSITKEGRHGDGGGLYLRVAPGGSKQWVLRVVVSGKRRDVGLGPYPAVSLAQARHKAATYRVAVADGKDPLRERRKAETPTFEQAEEKTYEVLSKRWRSTKTKKNWKQVMARYVRPIIGDMRVDEIGREQVLKILLPVWTDRPEQGRRIRRQLKAVLDHCVAAGYVDANFAGDAVSGALPSMRSLKHHHRTIPYDEVASAIEKVRQSGAHRATILAFETMILCATRSQECRLATWDEFDLEQALWTIPGERTKTNRPHRIPLSTRALEILNEAKERFSGEGLVFPSARGKPMSDSTISKLLRELEIGGVPHGIARASFRSWCADSGVEREVAEASLAHVPGETERAYQRADMLQRRRVVMERWSNYLDGKRSPKVVELRSHG